MIERMTVEGKSNSRKRHVKGCIHGAITWGIEQGLIKVVTVSPAFGIKVSRLEDKKPEILTLSEIRKLLESAQELEHPWNSIAPVEVMKICGCKDLKTMQKYSARSDRN